MRRTATIGIFGGLFLAMTAGPLKAQIPQYRIQDLGTLGGYHSFAYGINSAGQVVGNSETGFPPAPTHAFLWDEAEGLRDLRTLGGSHSYAYGINAAGQVVGCSNTESGETHAFLWTRDANDGEPSNPQMKDLGTLSGGNSCALSINDFGVIAGVSGALYAEHAVIWDPTGKITDIAPGAASSINSLGQVSGAVTIQGTSTDAFRWDPKTGLQDLVSAGQASSINDNGQFVGWFSTTSRSHGFLYDDKTGVVDLGTLNDCDCFSSAYGINNSSQIVGGMITLGEVQFALLWDSQREIHNLEDLVPPDSGWRLQEARAINGAGQIVGYGYNHGGSGHAFRLINSRAN
jgi:probable HAF family extracellular repeat protein